VKLSDGWLMTPPNRSLGDLDPPAMSRLDAAGKLMSGKEPIKDAFFHRAMYEMSRRLCRSGPSSFGHSVAVSCLADIDQRNVVPPTTAYYAMRIGMLPLIKLR